MTLLRRSRASSGDNGGARGFGWDRPALVGLDSAEGQEQQQNLGLVRVVEVNPDLGHCDGVSSKAGRGGSSTTAAASSSQHPNGPAAAARA